MYKSDYNNSKINFKYKILKFLCKIYFNILLKKKKWNYHTFVLKSELSHDK